MAHRRLVVLAVLVLVTASVSGCTTLRDAWDQVTAPAAQVAITPLLEGHGIGQGPWNQESRFVVQISYHEPLSVAVQAVERDGRRAEASSPANASTLLDGVYRNEAQIDLADGVWDITYFVDERRRGSLSLVHVDTLPPVVLGIEAVGEAPDGQYVLGANAVVEPGATVLVVEQATGEVVAGAMPATLGPLADGIHFFDVIVTDRAGNQAVHTVQVRVGDAPRLPEGQHSAGIVARYSNELRIWDISNAGAYLDRATARTQVDAGFLGKGYQILPDDPDVQSIVLAEVTSDMNTMEAAIALYRWVFDNLDYDQERLGSSDLIPPAQTIEQGGGVCRDLAALYVSLLRAAGVPARVVTGYLGGEVGGFHAWVEFYGGDVAGNPGPWVPVDVSPINGAWEELTEQGLPLGPATAMQHFAIKRPDYLTLRTVPPAGETIGWSTALSVQYPQNQGAPAFTTTVEITSTLTRVLCVDLDTWARSIASQPQGCQDRHIPGYPWLQQKVIDYGVVVAPGATGVTLQVAYPFVDDLAPDTVEFSVYGGTHRVYDDRSGTVEMRVSGA